MQNLLKEHAGDLTTTREFQRALQPLKIASDQVSGHVLLVGHGPAAPEQCLIGAPPYTQLYPYVSSVIAIDCEWIFPKFLFSKEKQHKLLKIKPPFSQNRKGVFSGIESFWELGEEKLILPNSLNCILFFRIVDLQRQLSDTVLNLAYSFLVKGGYFICSGGCESREYIPQSFSCKQRTSLRDVDESGYPFSNNTAFVLQKP